MDPTTFSKGTESYRLSLLLRRKMLTKKTQRREIVLKALKRSLGGGKADECHTERRDSER